MKKTAEVFLDYMLIAVGAVLYSVSTTVFLVPNHISPGGLTGVATILNYLIGTPIGGVTLMLNAPLFAWGARQLGAKFLTKTIVATMLLSVFIDISETFVPTYTGDRFLAALYGGLISGAGLAIVFLRGGSTGGFDIVAKIISLKSPLMSVGRVILGFDFLVVVATAIAYVDVETALYTVVALFIASKTIDAIVYGADRGRLALIVTRRPDEVIAGLFSVVGRGATQIHAMGGYGKAECSVIVCAIRLNEAAKLKKAVRTVDEHAFVVMTATTDILGEGFTPF